jgi:hypothetical protein
VRQRPAGAGIGGCLHEFTPSQQVRPGVLVLVPRRRESNGQTSQQAAFLPVRPGGRGQASRARYRHPIPARCAPISSTGSANRVAHTGQASAHWPGPASPRLSPAREVPDDDHDPIRCACPGRAAVHQHRTAGDWFRRLA